MTTFEGVVLGAYCFSVLPVWWLIFYEVFIKDNAAQKMSMSDVLIQSLWTVILSFTYPLWLPALTIHKLSQGEGNEN